jgi:hypothetical protein
MYSTMQIRAQRMALAQIRRAFNLRLNGTGHKSSVSLAELLTI